MGCSSARTRCFPSQVHQAPGMMQAGWWEIPAPLLVVVCGTRGSSSPPGLHVPRLVPAMGAHWALQMSGEPRGVSGCRGESVEPKPLNSGAVIVGNISHVLPGNYFGPKHKEGGRVLQPQHLFPGKVLARATLRLQPQGPGGWGQFRTELFLLPSWLQPMGRTLF